VSRAVATRQNQEPAPGRSRSWVGRPAVVTDDDVRALAIDDASEREPIVSRHTRSSSQAEVRRGSVDGARSSGQAVAPAHGRDCCGAGRVFLSHYEPGPCDSGGTGSMASRCAESPPLGPPTGWRRLHTPRPAQGGPMRAGVDDFSAGPSRRGSAAHGWERCLGEVMGARSTGRRPSRRLDRRHIAQSELLDRLFAEAELLDLSGHGHGQGVHEFPVAGDLVGGDPPPAGGG
jgi:hypothetical protein